MTVSGALIHDRELGHGADGAVSSAQDLDAVD